MCYSKLKHTRSSTQNKVTKISWSSKNTWSFCWWIILYCTKYLGKRKWGTSSWLVPYHTTYIHYTISPCIVWIARYGFGNFCHPVLIHLHVDLNQCFTDRQLFHILIDSSFRQGSRWNRVLKEGSRSDHRSYFFAEIEIGS